MRTVSIGGRTYEDRSALIADAQYKCKSCGAVNVGARLLPVPHEVLKGSADGIVGAGEWVVSNFVCPQDRGLVELITF